jgi:hypothetical protein
MIVKNFHLSRFWCIVVSSCIFCVGQICGASISNPHLLAFVAGINGCKANLSQVSLTNEVPLLMQKIVGYGFLFGVFPCIVAEVFGMHKMSQNWGWITLAPSISGNIFNLLYGIAVLFHPGPLCSPFSRGSSNLSLILQAAYTTLIPSFSRTARDAATRLFAATVRRTWSRWERAWQAFG